MQQSHIELTQADGSPLNNFGSFICKADLNGNTFDEKCYVTENCSLLGLDCVQHDRTLYAALTGERSQAATAAQVSQTAKAGSLKQTLTTELELKFPGILCGDYSTGLNDLIEDDCYPLPTAHDIFSTLNGGRFFTQIDLTEAYLQVPIDEESQKILTAKTLQRVCTR